MKTALDWNDYKDAGIGDAYADIPKYGGDYGKAVAVCIKSGVCQQPNDRGLMCPSFRATGDKALSPGGRVALLKPLLNDPKGFNGKLPKAVTEAMDSCVSCKGCRRECENALDMARIKLEYLAQRRHHPRPLRERLRTRLFASMPRWLHHHPLLKLSIRWRNRSRLLATLSERLLGIRADMPLPEPVTPFDRYASYRLAPGDCDLVLLADTFAHHFEPELLDQTLQLLEKAGYRITIASPAANDPEPNRPLCCGRTYLSQGWMEEARLEATRMLNALAPYLNQGLPVVGLEPSCLLTLRDEYRSLNLGEEAERLAQQSMLLEEFIAREQKAGRWPLAFKLDSRIEVAPHCHQRAFGATKATRRVLKSIEGLKFTLRDNGCCGMAGQIGFEPEQRKLSNTLWSQSESSHNASTALTVRTGFSCRHRQRAEGQGRAEHLVTLLTVAADTQAPVSYEKRHASPNC